MRVPVLFATNDKYVPYCRVAIASMLEHAAPENEYIVYIFHKGLSQDSTEALTAFARENVRVELREVGNYLHSAMREVKWYTQETYYRLMAADILPEEDKLLYLDCDIVVLEDVARLYAVDMGNALLAAVSRGDYDEAVRHLGRFPIKNFTPRTGELLRDVKNMLIVANTLLRKAAESGGVHPVS